MSVSETYYTAGAGIQNIVTVDGIASYNQSLNGSVFTLTHKSTGDISHIINAEMVHGSTIQYDNDIKSIVSLYDDVFDRQADLGGAQFYYNEVQNNGETLGGVALHFLYSAEYANNNSGVNFSSLNTSGQISEMYDALFDKTISQSTLDHWVDEANSGASMQEIADNFIASNDFQNTQLAVTQWDFIV